MGRCVIVGGAEIGEYGRVRSCFEEDDFFIFCDCGLRHMEPLGVSADLTVGDFDSYEKPCGKKAETIVLPCEKDDTDTAFALKEAIRRGWRDFLLVGVVGQRFDHTLANVSLLLMLSENGCRGKIVDDYSEMELVTSSAEVGGSFAYFSLLTIGEVEARGVTIKNAKYELDDATIKSSFQYGVSNEVLPGKVARISLTSGKLLLIKVFK